MIKKIIIFIILIISNLLYANPSSRIISLNGSITEILFSLGLGENIVGCDTTSIYPELTTKIPKVGYQRNLSAEGILSLNPNLVLATTDAGPKNVIQQLQSTKLKLLVFEDKPELEYVWKKIIFTGKATEKIKEAQNLVKKLQEDYKNINSKINFQIKPKVLFIYSRGQGNIFVSGKDTSASKMIELAGGVNAVQSFSGYKPLTPESLAGLEIDFVLVPTKALEVLGGKSALNKISGLELTKVLQKDKIVVMDDLLLLGFSTRIVKAIEELAKFIGTLK